MNTEVLPAEAQEREVIRQKVLLQPKALRIMGMLMRKTPPLRICRTLNVHPEFVRRVRKVVGIPLKDKQKKRGPILLTIENQTEESIKERTALDGPRFIEKGAE
jgi:hypothetical protein